MRKIAHFHFKPKHNVGDMAVVLAIRNLVEASFGEVKWESYNVKDLRKEDYTALLSRVNNCEMVIIGGGGFYSQFALPLNNEFIKKITKPIVVFGGGYNRNLNGEELTDEQKESVQVLGRQSFLTGVRDKETQDFLSSLGVKSDLIGDPALFLNAKPTSLYPMWRKLLDVFNKDSSARIKVGINIACHGWAGQSELIDKVQDEFVRLALHFKNNLQAEIFYLCHTDIKDELQIAKNLSSKINNLVIIQKGAQELKYIYSQMDLVVSMMLHSSIYAFGSQKPVINIGYDEKNTAFMNLIQHRERTIDVSSLKSETVIALATQALHEGFSQKDEGVLISLKNSTDSFVHKMKSQIETLN